jgi:hypothetical protein
MPDTTGSSILYFLLTAREGGLWTDWLRLGINSALQVARYRRVVGEVCPTVDQEAAGTRLSRRKWIPIIPPLTRMRLNCGAPQLLTSTDRLNNAGHVLPCGRAMGVA